MGLGPLIEKLEGKSTRDKEEFDGFEEWTESDSSDDGDRYSPEECNKRADLFEKKFKKHEEMIRNLEAAETFDSAFKWINKIDKFEEKHLALPLEYNRVIGELMNRLKVATDRKERFILIQKLNHGARRIVEWKEAYDPNNPAMQIMV